MSLFIAVNEGKGYVQIDELPTEDEAIKLLRAELPPLTDWLKLAMAFYRQGNYQAFERIMRLAISEEHEKMPQYRDRKDDRITILNRLSGFYLKKAASATDKTLREEYSKQASDFNRVAEKQSMNTKSNWVYRGYILLDKGNIDNAIYYFNNTLLGEPENILALLGRACISYQQGEYAEALEYYIKILEIHPRCPPNIRLGIGHCHYKLGNKDVAWKAYQRVLQLDPVNAEALIALAILSHERGRYQEYLHYLTEAYKADNSNTLVNLHLARHYFHKKDYEKSIKLAEICQSRLLEVDKQMQDISKMKAECYLVLAQCYHAQGDYEKAFRAYTQSTKFDKSLIVAQYGLGQMYIYQNDISKAIPCFEVVLEQHPGNYEASRILGSLYLKQHQKEQALEKLQYAVNVNPRDYEVWIEIAQSYEIMRHAQALEAYEKALAEIENPPAALLNNIAILRHKTGNFTGAQEAYAKIEDNTKTLTYNRARWLEEVDKSEESRHIYQKLLADHPNFIDAYLRLSMIERKQGDYMKALEYVRKAVELDKKPINPLCQKGLLEAELGEFKKSLDTLNKVINEHSHHDLYCLIAMGNQYYEIAVRAKEYSRFEKNLKRALEYYLKVLSLDEHNAYAATGAIIVLAELGDYQQAHAYFKQIFDSNGSMGFVLVNQAHLYFLQEKYDAAVKLYRKALENKASSRETVTTYLVSALVACETFEEAVTRLRELEKSPGNSYNLALVLFESARNTFKKGKRSVEESQEAVGFLEECIELFEEIKSTKWKLKGGAEARVEYKRIVDLSVRKSTDKIERAKRLLDESREILKGDIEKEEAEDEIRKKTQMELKELIGAKRPASPPSDSAHKFTRLN